jgi:hypothetical protein
MHDNNPIEDFDNLFMANIHLAYGTLAADMEPANHEDEDEWEHDEDDDEDEFCYDDGSDCDCGL